MKTIHKYHVASTLDQTTEQRVPKGTTLLSAAYQGSGIVAWGSHEGTNYPETEVVELFYVGTGWGIPDGMTHLATVCTSDGFVWHVFYRFPDRV